MVISQYKSSQKQTGAKYKDFRKKRKIDMGRVPTNTRLDDNKTKVIRTLGGNRKVRTLYANTIHVFDSKDKKSKVAKIKTVLENPANRHFVRRNILTKGTIVDTDLGKARITSRPGQDGTVNAVLI
ncbi:MAG: 30S ribosomal protein S8e [Candidatus Woesearchaeota archaeon]